MATLSYTEQKLLEKLFQMGGGWVLDFSNRTIPLFIADACNKDFDDPKYNDDTNSKAKRLRKFWRIESDQVVGLLIDALAQYAATLEDTDKTLVAPARDVAKRLLNLGTVADLDAIAPMGESRSFDALAFEARKAIDDGKPEIGLDRLHTYVISYLRKRCDHHGVQTTKADPLHSVMGKYVRVLRDATLIRSEMADRIIRSSISTLESFNTVRNDQSLAHDNEILDSDESLFIYNHVCALIRFLQRIDAPK